MSGSVFEIDGLAIALTHEHRGGLAPVPADLRPSPDLYDRMGGQSNVERLVDRLYERIADDHELARVFPHFQTHAIKAFFIEWLGGPRYYSGNPRPSAGLDRFHRETHVTPSLAKRWLGHMKAALVDISVQDADAREILHGLGPIARALVNADDPPAADHELVGGCSGVMTRPFVARDALRIAAARGKLDVIQATADSDPDLIRFRGAEGRSLLWEAVSCGRYKLAAWLLGQGANPNSPGCEPSVINLACSGDAGIGTAVMVSPWALAECNDDKKVATLLIENGALIDIFSAAYVGDCKLLSAILDRSRELVHAEDPSEDLKRITPLHHAVAGGQADAVACLISRDAQVAAHSTWLLTHAALQNRADLVALLLDAGADARCAGVLGPLDSTERPVADLLVSRGLDINSNPAFGAMLVRACRGDVSSNETHRVDTLLGYGADVNAVDGGGRTALHYAVRTGRIELLESLLGHGADVHMTDAVGLTPLDHLKKTRAKADPIPVMQAMVNHGADINHQVDGGETLLFFYTRRGDYRVVSWMLDHGADPDRTNGRKKKAIDLCRDERTHHLLASRTTVE